MKKKRNTAQKTIQERITLGPKFYQQSKLLLKYNQKILKNKAKSF